MAEKLSLAALKSLTSQYEGKDAIYRTTRDIVRVRLENVRAAGEMLFFTCRAIPTEGLNGERKPWYIPVNRDVLYATESYLGAENLDWRIFLDGSVIEQVLSIVGELPNGKTYHDDYETNPAPPGSHFIANRKPGPAASELMSFLRDQQEIELLKMTKMKH